jgi:phospholipid-binding lipoprotein MlaA
MPVPSKPVLAALSSLLLAGCATLPPGSEPDPRDPWEPFNRSMFAVNDTLDRSIARPVARGYVKAVPQPMRTGVGNFFTNLNYPSTVANSLLQGKFAQFSNDLGRLLVNTTLGIGGLFDPATQFGLDTNDEDLGQTLGKWGMPPGPFLMRPILGPSTVRDTFGDAADFFIDPKHYVESPWLKYGLYVQEIVHRRAQLLSAEAVQDNAYDPYSFMRNAWLQRREYLVSDGAIADDVEMILEEETPVDAPAGEPGSPADD